MKSQSDFDNHKFTNPIMTYTLNAKRDRFLSYMPFLLGICGLIIGCALFASAWNTLTMRVSGTLGPLAMVFLIFWRKKSLLRFNTVVTVFSEGFSYSNNGKLDNVRWDDVSEIYQEGIERYKDYSLSGNPTETTNKFTLWLTDGQQLVFDLSSIRKSYKRNIEGLGNIIHRECTNRIFPRLVAIYEDGHTISFGDLISINKSGLRTKNELLAWDRISAIRITDGFARVQKDGKWQMLTPVRKLPNAFVFLMLSDYVLKSKDSHKMSS